MNLSLPEVDRKMSAAGLSPLDQAKLKAVGAAYGLVLILFVEYSLMKHLQIKGYHTVEANTSLEQLEISEEIKKEITTYAQSRVSKFLVAENVCRNVGEAKSVEEVQAFMVKLETSKFRLRERVKVWVDRGMYRVK